MHNFNVLDRKEKIHQNYLLEASAGTGKTFSIENIVVRLLLENHPNLNQPLSIEQIVVVTFTRAAVRDLKIRIRANIEKALYGIEHPANENLPDYLLEYIDKGEKEIRLARRRLEKALFSFDQAQIFTIHSFCSRMLKDNIFESNLGGMICDKESEMDELLIQIIRDFFRTGLNTEEFTNIELEILLNTHNNSIEKLIRAILSLLKKGLDIRKPRAFNELFVFFKKVMSSFKDKYQSEKIISDFKSQARNYKKICNKQGEINPELLKKIEDFASLFDKSEMIQEDFENLIKDGLCIIKALDPTQLKSNTKTIPLLNYPNLIEDLKLELAALVEDARSPETILAKIAYSCQLMQRRFLTENEKIGFDDLLKTMRDSLKNPSFIEKINEKYLAAIIDEFQDTDPIQWEIFKKIFMAKDATGSQAFNGFIYLVGDPKQSIYAFRQADIYTYLDAANYIGADNHASLNVNFRSQPSLVKALNAIFSSQSTPGFIYLPRNNSEIAYRDVLASSKIKEKEFEDNKGSLHFCLAKSEGGKKQNLKDLESNYFFPFFCGEILYLREKLKFDFKQCAILVKDRYQGQRLASYLLSKQIPALVQRSANLKDSLALTTMRELLQGVLHPKNESSLKIALGGKIFGWTNDHILLLNEFNELEKVLAFFYSLRATLLEKGFALFFNELLYSKIGNDSKLIIENLLSQIGGIEFYQELQQIAQILTEEEYSTQSLPENLLSYLDQIILYENDNERFKKLQDASKDAVQILTLHSSKGLEYDIVFTLGLIVRSESPDLIIPIHENDKFQLEAFSSKDSVPYTHFCEEIDAEKLRQLYVAMTRAKYRVYAPVIVSEDPQEIEIGKASPMELFCARLGQPFVSIHELYQRIACFTGEKLCNFLDNQSQNAKITYGWLKQESTPINFQTTSLEILHDPPVISSIPGKKQFISSFTTLAKKGNLSNVFSHNVTPPHDFNNKDRNEHTLPSGSDTGNLLHLILEKLPFEAIKEINDYEKLNPFIIPHLKNTQFFEWKNVIGKMLYNASKIPLTTNFRLCDVSMNLIYREMEFLFERNERQVNSGEFQNGFIKGVIDLFFKYEDKYYLLDWKSNWLGPTHEYYEINNLKNAMEEEDYFLQAELYCNALKRYLRLIEDKPFDEIFGGIFYVFLRGLDFSKESFRGIYHFRL